jgi:hypothetical protein
MGSIAQGGRKCVSRWRELSNDEHGSVGMIDHLGGGRPHDSIENRVAMRANHDEIDVVLTSRGTDGVPRDTYLCAGAVEELGGNTLRGFFELPTRCRQEGLRDLRGGHRPHAGGELGRQADRADKAKLGSRPAREIDGRREDTRGARGRIEPDEDAPHGRTEIHIPCRGQKGISKDTPEPWGPIWGAMMGFEVRFASATLFTCAGAEK